MFIPSKGLTVVKQNGSFKMKDQLPVEAGRRWMAEMDG